MTLQKRTVNLLAWSSVDHPVLVRTLLATGPDGVVLDAQHGTWDIQRAVTALPVLPTDVPVWVRVADDRPSDIGRVLDAGATGVIVPMVDSPEDAARAAHACRYPPSGSRSWGPIVALHGRAAPGPAEANEQVRCGVMVETSTALAAVEAIAAAPGVDMVFVGPFDLALALGTSVDQLLADDAPHAPLPSIVAACRAAGIRAGVFAGGQERGERLIGLGFTDVVVCTDTGVLTAGTGAVLSALRGAGGPDGPTPAYG